VGVLEAIAEGWATGHKVRVLYRSPRSGEVRPRVIAPYTLEPTAVGIYVIGYDDWAHDIRTFKIERLEHAEILDEPYGIPTDFDPEAYLSTSWGIMTSQEMFEVVLRFSPAATPHLRNAAGIPPKRLIQHPTAVAFCACGSPNRWRCSRGFEVGRASRGPAPDWLRERVADELRRASDRYWLAPHDEGIETTDPVIEANDPAGMMMEALHVQVRQIDGDLAVLLFNPREADLRVGETLTLHELATGRSVIVQVIAFRSATYPRSSPISCIASSGRNRFRRLYWMRSVINCGCRSAHRT